MLRLITDFDGPIMDISERYYFVYQLCLQQIKRPEQEIFLFSKTEFWQMKRSRIPEREIGRLSGLDEAQSQQFAQLRHHTVHQLPYLVYDKLVPGILETLEYLTKLDQLDLVVMTMRRVCELEAALHQQDLHRFFAPERRYCISNDYLKTKDINDKPLLMERALRELPPVSEVWMIGDTEADIVAAKTHNVKVIGVLSGIRDRPQLEAYNPDYIVNNLTEAVELLFKYH
jgi:phosphoglycolate phosphatase-like HAD superfamily hydrolase